jgi:hypothetical protein
VGTAETNGGPDRTLGGTEAGAFGTGRTHGQQQPAHLLDQRNAQADERDCRADERERTAGQREVLANGREQVADERDRTLDEREARADKLARVAPGSPPRRSSSVPGKPSPDLGPGWQGAHNGSTAAKRSSDVIKSGRPGTRAR